MPSLLLPGCVNEPAEEGSALGVRELTINVKKEDRIGGIIFGHLAPGFPSIIDDWEVVIRLLCD